MREGNFRDDILYPLAGELGINHTTTDLRPEHVRGWIPAINRWMKTAWRSLALAELTATEERAFRTIWNATAQFQRVNAQGKPDEFLWLETGLYYRVKPDSILDDPIPGTLPSDTANFEGIAIAAPFIDLDQRGRHAVGEVIGVYTGDPMPQWCGWSGLPFRMSERGIEVLGAASRGSVWLRFKIRPSKFTSELWDNDAVYQKRDLVYSGDEDGQVYRSLVDGNQGVEPPQTSNWARVPVPAALTDYVVLKAAAAHMDDYPTRDRLNAQAETELTGIYDSIRAQGEGASYRLFPKRKFWADDCWWLCSPACQPPELSSVTTLSDIWEDDEFYGEPTLVTESGEAILA